MTQGGYQVIIILPIKSKMAAARQWRNRRGEGRGQGAECHPETSDREISADLPGKSGKEKLKRGKKRMKKFKMEKVGRKKNEKGGEKNEKVENGRREKFQDEERIFFFFFFFLLFAFQNG